MYGQYFIEKDGKEILRVNNNIHPDFYVNLINFINGNTNVLNDSNNWKINRFNFFDNQRDVLLSGATGIIIGTLNNFSMSSNNFILLTKATYSVTADLQIQGITMSNSAQNFSYTFFNPPIHVLPTETIVFNWALDLNGTGSR